MRLLHTTTLKLHEYLGSEIPYYAILSHRWGADEVTFHDLQQGKGTTMAGWAKIVGCCAQARKEGWEYAWIDSCCIDKTSSAELSEAINSMFQWYKDAQVCYAYLIDVPVKEEDHEREGSAFRKSKWFTRGWTLQELLAPQTVIFFNYAWNEIGTKGSLDALVTSITNIDRAFLERFDYASIAQKFSWASSRQTLRVEDTAYCLMGLFRVNMPLLYGEGNKAFLRLQLEIMKLSNDDSLFAWAHQSVRGRSSGLLARSPAAFQGSGDVLGYPWGSPFSMTNTGLQISLMFISAPEVSRKGIPVLDDNSSFWQSDWSDTYIAPLNCYTESRISGEGPSLGRNRVALRLDKIHNGHTKWYTRLSCDRMLYIPSASVPSQRTEVQIFVPQVRSDPAPTWEQAISKFELRAKHFFNHGLAISSIIDDYKGDSLRSIKTWFQADGDDRMPELILDLGLFPQISQGIVEFKGLKSPRCREEAFVLKICFRFPLSETIGINLLQHDGKSLPQIAMEYRAMELEYRYNDRFPQPRDRATITLPSGRVVSAALRKRARDGERVYVVDLDIQ